MKCSYCDSTGRAKANSKLCPVCNGTGKDPDDTDPVRCEPQRDCLRCDGKGYING
jgi:RecJ-like exonuclease